LGLWRRPPRVRFGPGFRPSLRWSRLACSDALVGQARAILSHRFEIFGQVIDTGPQVRWRRDYAREVETPLQYFRSVPYLDTERAGDHKWIWELNRHQHLVKLAQAFEITGEMSMLAEIQAQLESWFEQNPFLQGINWASALEVALRALSWIWVWSLAGDRLQSEFKDRWLRELYLHACFLENNLSFYFSPNTHLLGEALALHALGVFFQGQPRAAQWEREGRRVMSDQLRAQVREDGSHIEQSSYYHGYALDMFRLYAALARPDAVESETLRRMVEFRDSLRGPSGRLPLIGDDDGGRLIVPDFEEQPVIQESRLFSEAGLAAMVSGNNQVIVDAGPLGPWKAGHSHADTLSIIVRRSDEDILVDPGTFTYTGDARWRDWFRSTAAHSTIAIDGRNQATPAGPFGWADRPDVRIHEWRTDARCDAIDAECRYRGFIHRRLVEFAKPGLITIVDDVAGPPGEHSIEQWWHLGSLSARERFELETEAEIVPSWRSDVFGSRRESTALCVRRAGPLPMRLTARIHL